MDRAQAQRRLIDEPDRHKGYLQGSGNTIDDCNQRGFRR